MAGQGFDRGHAHQALQLRVAAADRALHRERLGLHALDPPQDRFAGQRGHVALGRPVQEPGAEIALERGETAAYGGLGDAQLTRCGGKAAGTGNS